MRMPNGALPRAALPEPWLWLIATAVIRGVLSLVPAFRGTTTLESD